ncbi:MAG: 16S rRNA (uracil(1498)-N(3))-methyltransferase [Nitrospirae bacterium]|nr:MAG: 16S rRNA (uracil(1498)-N(3))-methyltransferase [Nitrospirota bacterium]
MPAFFIHSKDIHHSIITIHTPSLFQHLTRSLRIRLGETIYFTDEQRRRYRSRIIDISRTRLEAEVLESRIGPPPPASPLTLAQAILKGEKMAWVVQKATELGVTRISPLITERSLIKLNAHQAQRYRQRLMRIALEAAQQAERWDIPTVDTPCPFEQFVREAHTPVKFLLVERHAGESLLATGLLAPSVGPVMLGIGPEGGWSDRELALAQAEGFYFASLGERILRAETAALAAVCLVQSRLSNL